MGLISFSELFILKGEHGNITSKHFLLTWKHENFKLLRFRFQLASDVSKLEYLGLRWFKVINDRLSDKAVLRRNYDRSIHFLHI